MLRMNVATRVADCVMPVILNFLSVCWTAVRYVPSGTVFTSVSNTWTISGRERCSLSMICMLAMNFCFCASRLLISSDLAVERGDLGAQAVVAGLLCADHGVEQQVAGEGGEGRREGSAAQADEKRQLALPALLFTPWK